MPNVRKWIKDGVKYDIVSKVDTTLSQRNIPGDAKATGDRLKEIETKIDNLDLSGKTEIINKPTHYDFPSIGSVDCIYKAYNEKKTYQWNEELLKYEPLNEGIEDVNLINGGNADGTFN